MASPASDANCLFPRRRSAVGIAGVRVQSPLRQWLRSSSGGARGNGQRATEGLLWTRQRRVRGVFVAAVAREFVSSVAAERGSSSGLLRTRQRRHRSDSPVLIV